MERRLSAILAADVVGYSRLMEQDEAGTFQQLKADRKELFEPEIAKRHGRVFKLMGDGLLAEFGSVVDAVECAVALQRSLAERNRAIENDRRIEVRIGINLGEVIVEGEDRYGEGVNIAARLQQLADPGGICVSGKVAKEVEKTLAFGFEAMGEQVVKNIIEPVPVYRVKLDIVRDKRPRRSRHSRAYARWATAAALTIVSVGALFAWARPDLSFTKPAHATIPSLAVLPFDNMSADPTLGYFADGVSEDIISMLARSPDLSVIARNSSFAFKGKATDVRQIGKELNVSYVLEGSVRKDADKVRIVAQLIDARTGEHVWAERFDKTGSDPWVLQDEVTSKILGALTGENGQVKRAQYQSAWGKDTADLEEYDYYLRGHHLFMQFQPEPHKQAGEIWAEGVSKYPDSPLLKINLGWFYYTRAFNGWSIDAEADYRRGSELVREAFKHPVLTPLERRLGLWLFAYVKAQERDFDGALRDAEAAVALSPYDAFLKGDLSIILILAGEPERAAEWADGAKLRDPADAGYFDYLKGWALLTSGKPEEALAALNEGAMFFANAPLFKAIALVRLNRMDEARTEVRNALKMDPTFTQVKWRELTFYSDPSILEQEIADLEKAGLPEG
jgi:TolB-like protein/class 3 adenylate cyclase